ncbi:MAG: DNA-formamidopyrimidine glycosylase family protein, partial [Acidimicrobiia bacterium]
MPELPEVEATRRAVAPALEGRRIVNVEIGRARMLRRQPDPRDFADRMVGRIIRRLDRHGKFLLAHLTTGLTWVTHLGMSGRVMLATADAPRDPHTNVVVRVGGGVEFRLVDPR